MEGDKGGMTGEQKKKHQAEYMKQYRLKHKEKLDSYCKEYQKKHKRKSR